MGFSYAVPFILRGNVCIVMNETLYSVWKELIEELAGR